MLDIRLVITHTIHVWYIYLHEWLIFMVNVGEYTIHGWYGLWCFFVFRIYIFFYRYVETPSSHPNKYIIILRIL